MSRQPVNHILNIILPHCFQSWFFHFINEPKLNCWNVFFFITKIATQGLHCYNGCLLMTHAACYNFRAPMYCLWEGPAPRLIRAGGLLRQPSTIRHWAVVFPLCPHSADKRRDSGACRPTVLVVTLVHFFFFYAIQPELNCLYILLRALVKAWL